MVRLTLEKRHNIKKKKNCRLLDGPALDILYLPRRKLSQSKSSAFKKKCNRKNTMAGVIDCFQNTQSHLPLRYNGNFVRVLP